MMLKVFDWFVVICVIVVIIVCSVLLVLAQETTTTTIYEYNGWQHKTTLRSNTWNAEERTPQPNERLYIYRDGIKQNNAYYEWDGHQWEPHGDAYFNDREE